MTEPTVSPAGSGPIYERSPEAVAAAEQDVTIPHSSDEGEELGEHQDDGQAGEVRHEQGLA